HVDQHEPHALKLTHTDVKHSQQNVLPLRKQNLKHIWLLNYPFETRTLSIFNINSRSIVSPAASSARATTIYLRSLSQTSAESACQFAHVPDLRYTFASGATRSRTETNLW